IPNANDLNGIYRQLDADSLGPKSNTALIFLKFCLQASILFFKPIANNHKKRDICANIWHIFGKAFNDCTLTLKIEQTS
ncbi:hypothetical protein HMPREF1544_00454, partial [Mucor circinelloides 1006PhL]